MMVGRLSYTPDDFPETARVSITQSDRGISYQAVNRLRRADGEFRCTKLAVSRCATEREKSSSGTACQSTSMNARSRRTAARHESISGEGAEAEPHRHLGLRRESDAFSPLVGRGLPIWG